ncbi:trypsin-like serine protease [Arthrobacter sp. NPDC093125]|uniref:trypsin-like serine protease n=1 Tax=Arthrobacter sp. NPDC093125 TaxID=3363944 RepID=UPI0037F64F58
MRTSRMLRAGIGAMVAVAALVVTTAVPAGAITGDYVKDTEHPFVGLVVFYDDKGAFHHRCSGALLTPTVFLTAGHCTAGASSARVYFQQDAGANWSPETGKDDPITGYPNTCAGETEGTLCATSSELHDYGFEGLDAVPETRDAGLVILAQPIELGEYASLAAAGTLDALAARRGQQETTFTASGYGVSEVNPVSTTSFRERLMAESRLTNLTSSSNDGYNVQTNGNGKDRGGTCTADSGGPLFYGPFTSNTITGITSFGHNRYCKGTGFSYRTDRQEVIDWITSVAGDEKITVVPLPTG